MLEEPLEAKAASAFAPGLPRIFENRAALLPNLREGGAPQLAFCVPPDPCSSTEVMLALENLALEPPLYMELFDRSAADIPIADIAFRGFLALMTAAAPAAFTLYLLTLLEELYFAFNARANKPSLLAGFSLEEDTLALITEFAFSDLRFVELSFALDPFLRSVEVIPLFPPPPRDPPSETLRGAASNVGFSRLFAGVANMALPVDC
jgi:hypothetical protein